MGMVKEMATDVERFQREVIGFPIPPVPGLLSQEFQEALIEHLEEELTELQKAFVNGDLEDAIDAIIDFVYVGLGGLIRMGVAPKVHFDAVHEANMKRVRGKVSKRSGGGYDAVKPPGWQAPDFRPYLINREELVRLQEFKAYVHERLDEAGVPTHPGGPHTNQGCRIGDRLDIALGMRESRQAFVDRIAEAEFRVVGPTHHELAKADDNGFLKNDQGKDCRPELIPPEFTEALGVLYARGAVKYEAENWRKGTEWQRYVGAMKRHLIRFEAGHSYDDVPGGTGAHELIAVAWNACTLFMHDIYALGEDNRPLMGDRARPLQVDKP